MQKLILSALLVCSVAAGQLADEQLRAKNLLSAPSLQQQAWGAYYASRLHDDALINILRTKLADAQIYAGAQPGTAEHTLLLTLFDALIESGDTVPNDLLMSFKQPWTDDVLILMARGDLNEDLLMSLRDEPLSYAQWLTVNNLLLQLQSPRLFVKTLQEITITHRFSVVPADGGIGIGLANGCGGGSHYGSTGIPLPKGFPPVFKYRLTASPANSNVLVSTGPRNVFYSRRKLVFAGDEEYGAILEPSTLQNEKLEYLAALNYTPIANAKQIFWAQSTITWHNDADFTAQAISNLNQQAIAIQSFIDAAKQNHITGATGLTLIINAQVEDYRRDNSPPLPKLNPFQLTIQ